MKDTAFSVPEAKLDRLATCYWADMKTGERAVFDEARGGNIQILPLLEPAARGFLDRRRLSGVWPHDAQPVSHGN
jgi:hypothetical protein